MIIVICLWPWYSQRRREKEQVRHVLFSSSEGVNLCEYDELTNIKTNIIKNEIMENETVNEREHDQEV